ncbi:MAG: hypothetical protein HUK14_05000 [Muribaculaceae bacterium]|nr:hypothetical protein [Muribaculaceae bacterium]
MKKFYMISAILALTAGLAFAAPTNVKRAHFATKAAKEKMLKQQTATPAAPAGPTCLAIPTHKASTPNRAKKMLFLSENGFSIGMELTFEKGTVSVTPDKADATYYFMVLEKEAAQQIIDSYTGEGDAMADYMCTYVTEDIKFQNQMAEIFGGDPVTFEGNYAKKGNVTEEFDAKPSTTYVAYAAYMTFNEETQACEAELPVGSYEATSPELPMSENVLTLTNDEDNIYVTTTNEDSWALYAFAKDEIAELKEYYGFATDEELFTYYVTDSDYIHNGNLTMSMTEALENFYSNEGTYVFFYAPYYKPSNQLWGELKSAEINLKAPDPQELHYTFKYGQAAWWNFDGEETDSNLFTLTIFSDTDEDGWLLPPYTELDVYTAKISDLAGTYSDEDFSLIIDTSYAQLDDYNMTSYKSGTIKLVATGNKDEGMAEYLVSGEFTLDNISSDKLIIDEKAIWFYAYDIMSDEQVILDPESGIETISADAKVANTGIFSLSGVRFPANTDVNSLAPGFYIVNGQKLLVK